MEKTSLLSGKSRDKLESRMEELERMGEKDASINSNSSNNNEEDYESNYSSSSSSDGRVEGASRSESAFSSASSSLEDSESSGRNSASSASPLNSTCNLAPQFAEALKLIESVRCGFLEGLSEQELDVYEELDLVALRHQPIVGGKNEEHSVAFRWISRFIDFQRGLSGEEEESKRIIQEAIESLSEYLRLRNRFQLTKTKPDHFMRELYRLAGMFPFGRDRHQLPVLYLRARVYRRWSAPLDETFRRYVAWQLDLITRSHPAATIVAPSSGCPEKVGSFGICFDCLHVSYACLDMDFLRFLVRLLVHHYPTYCRYSLCVDLPWLFRSVWKLVRSWLPEEAQSTVHLITSKELTKFIDADQIPNSMRIDNREAGEKPESGKHVYPDNFETFKSIEQVGEELNLTSSEINQFKVHLEKVRKEYEQLGAY